MRTPSRLQGMVASPIRRMAQGAPAGTISLGLGEPGWALPDTARRAMAELATDVGALPYGPNHGIPELVAAIAAHHQVATTAPGTSGAVGSARQTDPWPPSLESVTPDEVLLTAGSQAALYALFFAHVEAGTTVLVPDPGFVSYATLARLCGAHPITYPLGPGGKLDAAALTEVLSAHPHTSLVVLNHPANPTGGGADAETLVHVAQACSEAGALLVSDEVYRELWLEHRPAGLHEAAGLGAGVVLGSMSKAFGAPGLRIGWAVGVPELLAPARLIHNAMNTAPSRLSQRAALALLDDAARVLAEARDQVRHRWHVLHNQAPELSSHTGTLPHAGFYLWLPLPTGIPPTQTEELALRIRDESLVTTIPGTAFGPAGAGYLRVSLGGPVDELTEGLARLAPWWKA